MLITSVNNEKVKEWVKLKSAKFRQERKMFLVEGKHLIEEAHQANLLIIQIVLEDQQPLYSEYQTYFVSDNVMKKLSSVNSANKFIGLCCFQECQLSELSAKVIALENVQDPGNVGAILRTAYAFGYDSAILSIETTDIYNEKLIRASQGAFFHMRVIRADFSRILPELKEKGYQLLATDLTSDTLIDNLKKPDRYVLIFGNEGQGISQETLAISDLRFKIPMTNFDSLNVLSAASICMYILKTSSGN